MSDAIVFSQVSKSFGEKRILENFDLVIPKGITTALVGESGSGKSTLLSLANGLLTADAGEVRVMDRAIASHDLVTLRRQMGYAVQGAGLFPHLTAEDNVALLARRSGWSESAIASRVDALFELLNLDQEMKSRFPHTLSGGQQQRVSLCRAMILDPPILLLDEPFSALDPLTRQGIHVEFARLQSLAPRSILLVTHDMAEATRLAQYLVVLKEGAVVQSGAVSEVVDRPADAYVEALLGVVS